MGWGWEESAQLRIMYALPVTRALPLDMVDVLPVARADRAVVFARKVEPHPLAETVIAFERSMIQFHASTCSALASPQLNDGEMNDAFCLEKKLEVEGLLRKALDEIHRLVACESHQLICGAWKNWFPCSGGSFERFFKPTIPRAEAPALIIPIQTLKEELKTLVIICNFAVERVVKQFHSITKGLRDSVFDGMAQLEDSYGPSYFLAEDHFDPFFALCDFARTLNTNIMEHRACGDKTCTLCLEQSMELLRETAAKVDKDILLLAFAEIADANDDVLDLFDDVEDDKVNHLVQKLTSVIYN